jgi:nucleoside-diphosphate-sugar epimerase
VSTTAIYGNPDSPITEKTAISPNGDYALTKWEGEQMCQKYKKDVDIIIVRPSVLVGEKRLGIYEIIFRSLFKNSFIPILGNGKNKISFVDIDDFTDFLVYLIQKRINDMTINFGGIIPGDLNFVIQELKNYAKSRSKIIHIPLQFLSLLLVLSQAKILPITPWQLSVMCKDYYYDNDVLLSTGFKYRHDPLVALKSMVDFYQLTIRNQE